MKISGAIIGAALILGSQVHAEPTQKVIGNWLLSTEADRFGDGGTHFAAVVDGPIMFAVRCIQKEPSFGLLQLGGDPKPLTVGEAFKIKIRIDQKPIHETFGKAINSRLIQIPADNTVWRDIRNSREIAVRVETIRETVQTHIFKSAGGAKVLPKVEAECPLKD